MTQEAILLFLIGVLIGIAVTFLGDMIKDRVSKQEPVFEEKNQEKIACSICKMPIGVFEFSKPIETCGNIYAVTTPDFEAKVICLDCINEREKEYGRMSDLISRQAAIAEFSCCELTPDGGIDANYAIDFLKCMPSAQPEIIACGDCKYWICHDRRCGYWNHGVKPLDWCCHAERRTDG